MLSVDNGRAIYDALKAAPPWLESSRRPDLPEPHRTGRIWPSDLSTRSGRRLGVPAPG